MVRTAHPAHPPAEPSSADRRTVVGMARRSPRYSSFLATGAGAGLLAAVVLTLLGDGGEQFTRGQQLLYLGLVLMLAGGLVGGALAVLLEGRRGRAAGRDGAGSP